MKNKLVAMIMVIAMFYMFCALIPGLNIDTALKGVSKYYVDYGLKDNKGSNLVTSIVVIYRGLDTLGEVTVLFIAATGLSFLLFSLKRKKEEEVKEEKKRDSSLILQTSTNILIYPIVLFGIYIFVHGHLTPGGGFQGGSVIASGIALLLLTYAYKHISHNLLSSIESLAGFTYVLVGLIAFWVTGSFLANKVISLGTWNELFSAGIIPIIYTAIGIKVGAELSGLVLDMFRHKKMINEGENE